MINHSLLSKLDEISERINQLPLDLKAETVIDAMVGSGMDIREFLVAFDGQLQRNWSDDIASTIVETLETGDKVVTFHLNRDGMYDMLPELLFHNKLDTDSSSAEEMARDSMQLRKEERESRSFFQPFENGIFLQRVQLSLRENQLLRSIFSHSIMGLIPGFWNIPENLPDDYSDNLVKLIPFAGRIAGNMSLTAQSLSYVLKENVAVKSVPFYNRNHPDLLLSGYGRLGDTKLGVDSVCGSLVNGYVSRVIVAIGPIRLETTDTYVKNGTMKNFLDCFYSFFLPVDMDVETRFVFEPAESLFVLSSGDDLKNPYLGYNSVIE